MKVNVKTSTGKANKDMEIHKLYKNYNVFYDLGNSIAAGKIVKVGENHIIEWEDIPDQTVIEKLFNDDGVIRDISMRSKLFFQAKSSNIELERVIKRLSELEILKSEESKSLFKKLEKITDKLEKLSKATKSGLLLPSALGKMIEKDSGLYVSEVQLEGNTIVFWLEDPGEWEQNEESIEEEEVLTNDSQKEIEQKILKLSEQLYNFEIEDYHLATVKCTIQVRS